MAPKAKLTESQRANRTILLRTLFLMALCGVVLFVPLFIKLYNIQIVRHDFYEQKAVEQQTRDSVISPLRGTIYDRNMKPLAVSASVETVYISPADIKEEKQAKLIAQGLSEILEVSYDGILERCENKKSYYQVIKKKIEKPLADEVRAFIAQNKLADAVHIDPDYKRYYPYNAFASHVIGFVSEDNQGLEGVEAMYNSYLTGTPGRVIAARDARGSTMNFQYEKYYDAQNGLDVVLTIDQTMQEFLEKTLENAVIEYDVRNRAAGIIMDVKTGEILAMDTQYDYNLNSPRELVDPSLLTQLTQLEGEERQSFLGQSQLSMWRNKAVNDTYEPGSTFKIITTAIALEENAVKLDDQFSCTGSVMVAGWGKPIRCHKTAGHGSETFVQGVQNSCNPVFIAVAQRVGQEKFYNYMKAFGLFEKTGIDMMGESGSIYHAYKNFDNVTLSVYSFGQTFQITPIQLITAVSAVANGGKLMKPHIVKDMLDSDGNIVESIQPEVVRQVISEETSKQVCEILETVVDVGTGKNARVEGYRIAGKTGTSQKRDPVTKQYMDGKYIVSFVALAPADDPKIAALILLDEPMAGPPNLRSGGNMAAPTMGRLLSDVLPYLNILPKYNENYVEVMVPPLTGHIVSDAEKLLKEQKIKYRVEGEGETVSRQIPAAGARVPNTAEVILYLGDARPAESVKVPDLMNKTPQQVNQALSNVGLYMRATGAVSGSGSLTATWQSVAAGQEVKPGTIIEVQFLEPSVQDFIAAG